MLRHHLPERRCAARADARQCQLPATNARKSKLPCTGGLGPGVALWPADLELTTQELHAVESKAVGGLLGSAELHKGKQATTTHGCTKNGLARQRVDLHRLRDLVQELYQLRGRDSGRQVPDVQLPHGLGICSQSQGADRARDACKGKASLQGSSDATYSHWVSREHRISLILLLLGRAVEAPAAVLEGGTPLALLALRTLLDLGRLLLLLLLLLFLLLLLLPRPALPLIAVLVAAPAIS
mmetsp:Transcript_105001/g.313694  ORF Transcript_105001/g.313694 Transcript_105001/m.313694 type:complete len:240 (-) Transcript_105001:206-925(-)